MASGRKALFDRFNGSELMAEIDLMRSIDRFPFFHTAEGASRPRTRFQGREMINLGSNNYLGLADDERVVDATCEAARRWGAGSTGSRMLNGHTAAHEELEELIAGFTGQEAALVFSTGYAANLGAISGLLRRGDHALTDEEAHASILDGVLLSGARLRRFDHNDVEHLERLLESGEGRPAACLVDGVYSMRGDAAPLDRLADVCEAHGVVLIDDEAHGLGVLGPTGVGAAEAQSVLGRMDLISLTFSKSLGTCGGAVAGDRATIEWLKMTSRPFLFTASNTPGSLGAAMCSLRLLMEHPHWPGEVRSRAEYLRELLVKQGVTVAPSDSAILTVDIGSDAATGHAWRLLWNRGVFCNPVVAPAVKAGHGLLRLSVMRTHSDEDLEEAATAFASIEEAYALAGR